MIYQRKYYDELCEQERKRLWWRVFVYAYLRGADLVERDKGKSLGHHGGGEVLFGEDKGD